MLQISKNYSPVISVIIPTFNRALLIKRAIESVIKQTFKGWELIIVDDGSIDETFSIVNNYISAWDNIRYLKHSNRGLPLSRNAGIETSSGKYVTFLDSDDEYLPGHLELRLEFMSKHSEVDLIHGGIIIVGNPFVRDKNDLSKLIHLSQCSIGGTFFGKKSLFQSLNGFKNIEYSEDSELLERAERKMFSITKVNFPTYIYHRETQGSICNNKLLNLNVD
jgi:glycosyltransferase involved in cell wall biosynthesis